MFKRRKRFPRAAFPKALSSGRRLSSKHFSAVIPKNDAGYAVIVSKKTAREAVQRHRIKRRVLEALRKTPLPPALLLFPKSSVAALPSREIEAELSELISKIGKNTVQ